MKLITRRDALIIATILAVAVAFLIIPALKSGEYAEISFDGKAVKTVSLRKNEIFTINNITFEIKDGKISVTDSPCRDKICEHTGFIGSPSQTIVCLPEKMSVRIVGKSDDIDISVG